MNHPLSISGSEPPSRLQQIRQHVQVLKSYAAMSRDRILALNQIIQDVAEVELIPPTALLGQILHLRPYEATPGGSSSGQVLQAGLLVPGGMGLLIWDTEEFHALEQQIEGLESEARRVFVPYDRCSEAYQGYLGTQYDELVARFVGLF